MADDKKKDTKGPPKKDAKPADGGGSSFSFIVAVIVIAVLLSYLLTDRNIHDGDVAPSWGEILSGEYAPEGSPLAGDDSAGGETIDAGATVVNEEDTTVRLNLSGAVAGEQPARAKGVVKEGPKTAFGREWYFVDYEEAPDGWVEASAITGSVGIYTATHIVPIAFDFFRPLAIGLALAVAALLVYLWVQAAKQERLVARRAAEDYRAYLERTGRAPAAHATETPLAGAGDAAPFGLPGADLALPIEWGAPSAKPPRENERWARIRALTSSATTSDWRQAIIEADIMLEEMLRAIGYDGVTIGDMLKNVDPADFVTLEKAWEAHKIRNQIAHRGMDFRVERTEAERTIKLFEDVFREFNYL